MPFGLTNAPALFQALINNMLCPCLDCFACAYLDNIVVYLNTFQKHIRYVQEVLRWLQAWRLFVQKEKCKFHKEVIKALS